MTATGGNEKEIQRLAQSLNSQGSDWVTFYREVLGVRGIVRRTHRTPESLAAFEQTQAYRDIQEMLTKLRKKKTPAHNPEDPTEVITVRLPKSLHESLRVEAHEHHVSMNKLCISKLLRFIAGQMVPSETSPLAAEKQKEPGADL